MLRLETKMVKCEYPSREVQNRPKGCFKGRLFMWEYMWE